MIHDYNIGVKLSSYHPARWCLETYRKFDQEPSEVFGCGFGTKEYHERGSI